MLAANVISITGIVQTIEYIFYVHLYIYIFFNATDFAISKPWLYIYTLEEV